MRHSRLRVAARCFGARSCVAFSLAVAGLLGPAAAVADDRLRLGMREDAPPFSSRVEVAAEDAAFDIGYMGFSVGLCAEIVKMLRARTPDLTVEHVGITAQTRFPSDDNTADDWDLLCDPTSITQARLEWCSFSFPFFVTGIAYAAGTPGASAESLNGQPAALVGETTTDTGLEADWVARYGATPVFESVQDYEEAVRALQAGTVAAIFGDQVLLQQALTDAGMEIEVSREVLSIELYGLCVAPDRPDLLAGVNATLASLYRSGEIYSLLSQSFDGRGATRILSNLYTLYSVPEK